MSKYDILLTSINKFYTEEKNKTKLLNILDKTSGISSAIWNGLSQITQRRIIPLITTSDGKFSPFIVHISPV